MTTAFLIEAQNITKSYGKLKAVEGVSLRLQAGEIMTIIGPNGSGKTTLLKLLLGLETPDSGTVERTEGLKVGYLPQKMQVDPILPMNVEWFLKLYARGKADIAAALEEVEAAHLLKQPLQELSGGETQRVLLARALLAQPQLLVLDEPVQGVDVNGQTKLYELISRVARKRNCAVLMVSHDLHLVMSATDEVICLNHHICCAGHPHKVSGDPAFSALFGDHAAKSLAVYTHHHNHQHDHS